MLRFDQPQVGTHVARWEALLNGAACAAALLWSPWIMVIPAVQGLIRGFWGHRRCPLHRIWQSVFEARGWAGRPEDAGPKMFANKLLFVASAVALGLAAAGQTLWRVPCLVLQVFTTLEWALSFCAACWVYGLWYRRRAVQATDLR